MTKCEECNRYEYCRSAYDRAQKVDVLFVQDCARIDGELGYTVDVMRELRSVTKKVTNKKFAFVNLVNVVFKRDKNPTKRDVNKCADMFMAVLQASDPKYIVAIGPQVFQVLTGKSRFSDWTGRVVTSGRWKVIPVYHPDYAQKSKKRSREYNTQTRSLVSMLTSEEESESESSYKLLTDEIAIISFLKSMRTENGNFVQAFDYETTHLDPDRGVPVCLSISWERGKAACLYFFDREEWDRKKTNSKLTKGIQNAIRQWMTSRVPKVAQNAKFEIKWTKYHFGVEPENIVGDTKQMQHIIDETVQNRLTDLAYQYTDMGGYDTPMQEFLDSGHEHWQASPDFMLPYSAGDADCTRQVYMVMREKVEELDLTWLERNIVLPAVITLARIESRGMMIDWERAEELKVWMKQMVDSLQKKINLMPEVIQTVEFFKKRNKNLVEINLSSTPQMRHLLYDVLRLPILAESKKSGLPSTSADVLEELAGEHPIIDMIVKMRSFLYQLSDLDTIEKRKRSDGTVASNLVQDYVVTGRLSSRDPNLQNIKGDTDEDPSYVKECFISRFGKDGKMLQADESQLELRLIGSESNEPKFIQAFRDGIDMHSLTGAEIHKIPLSEFLTNLDKYKSERIVGKRINFGVIYGITEHGLSVQLKCTKKEALEKINAYWLSYPCIRKWMKSNEKEALEYLEVRNRFGRIRHVPEVLSDKWWIRDSALRTASNSKIQSLGADICMWCMVQIDKWLVEHGMRSCVIGQIHDSVLVDAHKDEIEVVKKKVKEIMGEGATRFFSFLSIPLKVDVEEGDRWNELKKV